MNIHGPEFQMSTARKTNSTYLRGSNFFERTISDEQLPVRICFSQFFDTAGRRQRPAGSRSRSFPHFTISPNSPDAMNSFAR